MINLSNPDFITGIIVAVVLAVIYLVGHYHGKSKAVTPTAKPVPVAAPEPKTVIVPPVAHPELVQAIAEVKAVADKIHEHLSADNKPEVPTEPPKAA